MKTKLSIAVVVLLIAGAALASQGPKIDARITTETTAQQIRNASGPLNVTFQIAVTNQSDAPVRLTRVEVLTDDASDISLTDGTKKVHIAIAPAASENITLVAKSIATADLARTDSLQVFVRLTFKGPGGEFVKQFSRAIQ